MSSSSTSGPKGPKPPPVPPKAPPATPTTKPSIGAVKADGATGKGAPPPPNPLVFCVVLIVEATTSPLVGQLTQTWLEAVASALTQQLNVDVSAYYGGTFGVRVGGGPLDVQPGEVVFSIVDTLPQAPGAVAYHDVDGHEVPVAFLALSTCSTLDDVSTALSHELCEIAGDAACNEWVDAGNGQEFARELSDAVQANIYTVDTIAVSDFLLPAFFAAGAPGPYCFTEAMGVGSNYPTAPFATTSGGYQIVRDAGGNEAQVTAKAKTNKGPHVVGTLGKRAAKSKHWSSRTWRRGVRPSP